MNIKYLEQRLREIPREFAESHLGIDGSENKSEQDKKDIRKYISNPGHFLEELDKEWEVGYLRGYEVAISDAKIQPSVETNGMELISSEWYGSMRTLGGDIVQSGCVLIFNGYKFRSFIGVGVWSDEKKDIKDIMERGNQISQHVALAIFGDVKIIREGKEYSVKENYRV